jgi:hypothetical protein
MKLWKWFVSARFHLQEQYFKHKLLDKSLVKVTAELFSDMPVVKQE